MTRGTGRSLQRLLSGRPQRGLWVQDVVKIFPNIPQKPTSHPPLQVSKAAIGLARLCLDPTTADSVVRLGGLDKLFPLAEVNLVFSIPSLQSRISILSSKAGWESWFWGSGACDMFRKYVGGVKKSSGWEFEMGDNRAKVVMWRGWTHQPYVCHPKLPPSLPSSLHLIQFFGQILSKCTCTSAKYLSSHLGTVGIHSSY